MFSLFSARNRSLGIDVGTTGVKVVELKKENNAPVLTNYSFSYDDSTSFLQSSGVEILDDQMGSILHSVVKRGQFATRKAVVGIPGFLALISFMELPEMSRAETDKAVRFEANKYIPTPLEEVSLGWEIIGSLTERAIEGSQTAAHQSRKMQIMVVTVPKSAIEKMNSVMEKSRLDTLAVEVENFATVRCLIGNDRGSFMIVNIGAKATDFTIVSDGIIRATRSIDVGGVELTRAIASGFGVDLQRADKIKRSKQINLMNINDRLTSLVGPVVGMIVDEIKRLHELYHRKNPLNKIEKIIFTGGTSKLATLVEYISSQVSIECQLGNSLARVGVESKYQPIVEKVAPELTVAIGLALRGLDEIG